MAVAQQQQQQQPAGSYSVLLPLLAEQGCGILAAALLAAMPLCDPAEAMPALAPPAELVCSAALQHMQGA